MGSDLRIPLKSGWAAFYFNPRSRMGSDITPHTDQTSGVDFNPRSRMGSDYFNPAAALALAIFQSTLPHGERPFKSFSNSAKAVDFNPRSRMGSDAKCPVLLATLIYFNPRSRMGSDQNAYGLRVAAGISIHAPAWGATLVHV